MGGSGSGRQADKMAVEDCLKLSLSKMLQQRQLTEHASTQTVAWVTRFGEVLASFTIEITPCNGDLVFYIRELSQTINLSSTPLHFGGKRWWFHCPRCNRRCGKLSYAKGARRFYCRLCLDLTYRSSQESHKFDDLHARLAVEISRKRNPVTVRDVARTINQADRSHRPKWKRKRDRKLPSALDIIWSARFGI